MRPLLLVLVSLLLSASARAEPSVTWPVERGLALDPQQDGPQKTVRAFGYLVALPSGVRLELAHDRTEASVVYLTGDVAEHDLRPRASAGALVRDRPDAIVSASPGGLLAVYGPGWLDAGKHAIVAGDVLVAVRGRAVFRGRGALPHDTTRSGLSWTLAVDSVERILDRTWWEPYEKAQLARLASAQTELAKGRWDAAAAELEAGAAALAVAFGPDATGCNWLDATRDLAKRMRTIAADASSSACTEDPYRPDRRSASRPVPHPADLALYAAFKRAKEDRFFANIPLGTAYRHAAAVAEDRAAMCWWESTEGDPSFPTARHREVAATYLYFASALHR